MTETVKTPTEKFVIRPRGESHEPLLDEAPVGHLQGIVLRTLYDLKDEAYGLMVLQTLTINTGVFVDHAQIYSIIRKLKGKGLIEETEVRKQEGKRPPLKIYGLTDKGHLMLQQLVEHYTEVLAYFKR